jgi:hypothetical protein
MLSTAPNTWESLLAWPLKMAESNLILAIMVQISQVQ